MTFQIVCVSPTYHISTDAIIGSHVSERRPYAYRSEDLARKIAGRLTEENYNNCGDDHFAVVPYGESPFSHTLRKAAARNAEFDEIPF